VVDPKYARWCPTCDWGITPQERQPWTSQGRGKIIAWALRRHQDTLSTAIQSDPKVIEKTDLVDILATVLSIAITVALVSLACFGAWVIYTTWISPLSFVGLFLMVLVGWLLRRPQYRIANRVDRIFVPHLSMLCDQISGHLGSPTITHVCFRSDFSLGVYRSTLSRQVTLFIGLALWEGTTHEEHVALLGHEFGHLVNRHIRYRAVTATAVESMNRLEELLAPDKEADTTLITLLTHLLLFIFRIIPIAVSTALMIPLLRSGQRAEYRCDISAVSVGGTDATTSGLDIVNHRTSWEFLLERYRAGKCPDPYSAFRELVQSLPEQERRRRQRVDELSQMSIDVTHPAMFRRRALVKRWPQTPAHVTVSPSEGFRITQEVEQWLPVALTHLRSNQPSDENLSLEAN
jgi:hypothetical protein